MNKSEDTKIDKLIEDVRMIRFILESDGRTKSKGLVERVSDLDDSVDGLETREKVLDQKIAIYGVIGGSIVTVVYWIGRYFITKD